MPLVASPDNGHAILSIVLSPEEYNDARDLGQYDGFAVICPPTSPIRTAGYFEKRQSDWTIAMTNTSFIRDHVEAMNPCDHPDTQAIHGFTAW